MIKIRIGYELLYDFPQPTPLIMVLGTHFSRASDIDVPMDFAGWFEAYLGGHRYALDPRTNAPRSDASRSGHGRDAADVPIIHTFGPNTPVSFKVWTDEVF